MAFKINIPGVATTKTEDINLLSKAQKTPLKKTTKSGGSLIDKITIIKAEVLKHLGSYEGIITTIHTKEELNSYVDKCLKNGIVAVDTETTGLDPLQDKIVGFSLYTPGEKAVYIPINHTSYVTMQRLTSQMTELDMLEPFTRLNTVKIIMHNAKFDIRFIKNCFGVKLNCYWDTMIGCHLIDETESKALKYQYGKIFEDRSKKEYDFESLFGGIDFACVPIDIATYYAALDPYKTYKLYEYQQDWFNNPDNVGPKNIMLNIEMPVLPCVIDMEEYGVCIDKNFSTQLSIKYHERCAEIEKKVYDEINKYEDKINAYKIINPNHKLSDPISIKSPQQLAVLLYDIIGISPPDKENPRGTGEEILVKIKNPLCEYILEYRGALKLLSTYIDTIPQQVNIKTNKLHASFLQVGTDTGRFSSREPKQHWASIKEFMDKLAVNSGKIVLVM